ncbi:hypothetical protein JKY79_01800 [Candidatus Babeliales bacterium]|nr:hypothetical protein [Candidatus Babeliales bacterium]
MKKIILAAVLLCGISSCVLAEGEAPRASRLPRATAPRPKHGTFVREKNTERPGSSGGHRSAEVQKDMAGIIKGLRQKKVERKDRSFASRCPISTTEMTRHKGQRAARRI